MQKLDAIHKRWDAAAVTSNVTEKIILTRTDGYISAAAKREIIIPMCYKIDCLRVTNKSQIQFNSNHFYIIS